MTDINLTISITTLNVNVLNNPVKIRNSKIIFNRKTKSNHMLSTGDTIWN